MHLQGGVSDEVVAAYRLPQLVRGWEAGLVRFLLARVTDSRSFTSRVAAAFHGREHLTQIERLVDVVAKHQIPVRALPWIRQSTCSRTNSKANYERAEHAAACADAMLQHRYCTRCQAGFWIE